MGPALIGIALLLGLAISECGLRAAWHNPFRDEPSDFLLRIRIHHPNRDLRASRRSVYPDRPTTPFRTDERGYILPSRRFEDPDYTVAFLGGSTTECIAVTEELRFHAQVSHLLEKHGLRVNALNAARSGNTVHDSLHVLLDRVVQDEPDVALMMHAANDLGILAQAGDYRSRTSRELTWLSFARWSLQEVSTRSWLAGALRKWLTMGQGEGAGVRFAERAKLRREQVDVSTEPFVRRLRAFVGLARGFGIEPVLLTQPAISMVTPLTPGWIDVSNQQRFNEAVRRVAREEQVALIDLVRHLVEEVPDWNEPMEIFYDGIHVTDIGSLVYAEHIAERLVQDVLPGVSRQRPPVDAARLR